VTGQLNALGALLQRKLASMLGRIQKYLEYGVKKITHTPTKKRTSALQIAAHCSNN
jgi:hypothetical protein